jgi:hypothetical protein
MKRQLVPKLPPAKTGAQPADDGGPDRIDLSHLLLEEPTPKQLAEQNRRLKAIAEGRHPDTGKKIRPGDEKFFSGHELATLMRLWRLEVYGPDFVRRMLGESAHHRMRQAIKSGDLRETSSLRKRVNAAAARKIAKQWSENEPKPAISSIRMRIWAERLVTTYGARIVDETRFIDACCVYMSQSKSTSNAAFDQAVLKARAELPGERFQFEIYDPPTVENMQNYGRLILQALEQDYTRERNPVLAWDAFSTCRHYGFQLPPWLLDYLAESADRILEISDAVASGRPVNREAEAVGKALGFGLTGRGAGKLFKTAGILRRDRELSAAMEEFLAQEQAHKPNAKLKLRDISKDVGKAEGTSGATVERALKRISRRKTDSA